VTYEAVLTRPGLQHVPLTAIALAVLLHGLTAGAVWWLSPPPSDDRPEEPIMLLFDSSPSNQGLQEPVKPGPPAESIAASVPLPVEPQRTEPDPAPSLPLFEFSVPPVTEPPPAPSSRDFVKPAQPPTRAVQRAPLLPRPPATPQRPPAELPATMPSPVPGPAPADVLAGQGRQRNDYLTRVFRHLEPFRFSASGGHQLHGRVVSRVTLTRDGRLIDVHIASSSGVPSLDAAELAAIRKASPFPPVPEAMPGDPVILVLPITY
jgi:protein TonB